MSHRPTPSLARSSLLCEEVLEDAFLAWAVDPAKPDTVRLDGNRHLTMLELSRRLRSSNARLSDAAVTQLGLAPDATIATAVAALLEATVAPDGPRCRSFRSACLYLRGLTRLEAEPEPEAAALAADVRPHDPVDARPGDAASPEAAQRSRTRRIAPPSARRLLSGPALFPPLGARRANGAAAHPEKEHV